MHEGYINLLIINILFGMIYPGLNPYIKTLNKVNAFRLLLMHGALGSFLAEDET